MTRLARITLLLIVGVTLLHWAILLFELPVFRALHGWFWWFETKSAGSVPVIAGIVVASALAVVTATTGRGAYRVRLALLILLGVSLQFLFAFLEGRGMQALRDRIERSGHAEFALVAARQDDVPGMLREYESRVESGGLGEFARSKPPGTLLFYVATGRLAELGLCAEAARSPRRRLAALRELASYLWPILAGLALIPLYGLGSLLFDRRGALLACLLYLFVPSAILITLHADQVIYPFLFLAPVWVAAVGFKRARPLLCLLAGLFLYVSAWFSFALAFALPVAVALGWCVAPRDGGRSFLKGALSLAAGVLLADLAFRAVLGYDFFLRYEHAMAFHAAWKGWNPALGATLYVAGMDLIEFAVWTGVPLTLLFLLGAGGAPGQVVRGRGRTAEAVAPLVLLAVLLFLALFGKTVGEVARLWLFLVPLLALVAARSLATRYERLRPWVTWLVVLLQLGTVYLTKAHQDFW